MSRHPYDEAVRARCPKCGMTTSDEATDCEACGYHLGDDIVVLIADSDSSGGDVATGKADRREPRLRAKPLLGILAVLVAAVWSTTSGGDSEEARPRPSTTAVQPRPSDPLRPNAWSFPALGVATGTTLYLSSDGRLSVVDVDAGKGATVLLPELTGGDPPYRLLGRSDKIVFYGRAGDDTGIYVLDPDDLDSRTLIGVASLFLPSANEDRVWLVDGAFRPTQTVREVALDGKVTVAATRTPNLPVLAAVSGGLVLGGQDGLVVWDPTTGRSSRITSGQTTLVGARSDQVAVCTDTCTTLVITDLPTGRSTSVPAPPGFQFTPGVYSPSGNQLAFPALAEDGSLYLGIVDPKTGAVVVAPTTISGPFQSIVWSPSGRWVFFAQADGHYGFYGVDAAATFLVPGQLTHPIYGLATSG